MISRFVQRFLSRHPRLLRRQRGRRSKGEIRRLLQELNRRGEGLKDFGRSSDGEFTRIAQGIATLTSRLSEVRQQTRRLNSMMSDQDEDRALSSAYTTYKSSVDLVHSSVGIAISEQQQMQSVEQRLQRISDVRQSFKRNSLMFRMLAMGIRMEAARLDADSQGTFLNVSGAITDIEQRMFETTEAAFERIAVVTQETADERRQLGELQSTLHARAQHSILTIQEELGKVQRALIPCADESRAIEELMTQTQPHVTRLITALQYQDIVRQKLEHVTLGFDDLTGHAAEAVLDLAYVHHATQIQATQLDLARTEIGRAAAEITQGMTGLIDLAERLLGRFNAMNAVATAAFRHCRFAAMFQEEIHNLSQIAQQSEQTNQKISRLVERIEDIVQVFARDIGKHEFDVRLVALNAQIAAARLSSADALNRLAEESIHVSSNNAQVTRMLAEGLDETLAQLGQIKREAGEFLTVVTSEKAALETNAVVVGSKLHRLTEGTHQTATEMNRDFAAVHEEIKRLIAEVTFPREIESACEPAAQLAQEILRRTQEAGATGCDRAAQLRLDHHQKRYTMSAERALHARSVGHVAPATEKPDIAANPPAKPTEVAAPAATSVSSGFGDGIELF